MTIDLSTPMLGPVDVAATPDPRFLGGKYDDATVRGFWELLRQFCGITGFRASIIAAQIAKETGWFRFGGQVRPDQFNLAGLGATNDGASGASYADIGTGVQAVLAHHCTYHYGQVANWPDACTPFQILDKRYAAVLSTGYAGKIRVLGDFTNGVWAYSKQYPIGSLANGYATGIRDIANTLTTGGITVATPYDRIHVAADVGPARALADIQWFIVHDTEGQFTGDESVLTSPAAPIESAHFILGKQAGQCVYSVPLDATAWTPGNDAVAVASVNVEMSGYADAHDGGYTDYQYTKLAEIYRWCVAQGMVNVPAVYIGRMDGDGGPLPDKPGLIGHSDVPDGNGGWGGASHHTDPGPSFDWARFVALIGGAPGPTDTRLTDGHALGAGFTDYVAALNGLPNNVRLRDLGLCMSDEYDGYLCSPVGGGRFTVAPVVIANFERGRLIWDKGATAAPWDIRRPMANELCGPADQSDIDAVLKNPNARVN